MTSSPANASPLRQRMIDDMRMRQHPDPCTASEAGSDMNSTVPRTACRTLALRQRGQGRHVCVCRFVRRFARPFHHRGCATAPLRQGVSARSAPRLSVPHPPPLRIPAYQSP
jgi:hypothetical protein